jgi:outer membrane scaffolding protein for murein synthesis (MipA/OmpV family)
MRHAVTISLLSLCAFAGQSRADALEVPSSAEPKTSPAAGDSLTVGAGVAYVPEYVGSDKNRVLPVPFLERTFDNGAFISTMRGVGFQTTVEGFNLSAALGYGGARKDHKTTFSGSDDLRGMGDIDGAAQAVLGVGYQLGRVGLNFSTAQNLGHRENGATYTLGAKMALYTSASDQIGLSAGAVYGDDKHAQTYFGVTAAQSASSGYKAYTAKAGFETASATLNWNHVIDKTWSVHTMVGVTRVLGDAADSPLTKRKTTPMLMTGFSYKF